MSDERFMARAVELARTGTGATYPNPCVGAVVVAKDVIVGEGRTQATGGAHAEVMALRAAGELGRGATLYVTLEPCSHVGRTGPCTAAIIAAGVRRVVVGVTDPAGHADGKGFTMLEAAGIEVVTGVATDACEATHEHYLHHTRTGRPFVSLKVAMSLDGRVATPQGDSKWITGELARAQGHRLRAEHHAIAVGVETLLVDDPRLDVRLVEGVSPMPVVFDSALRSVDAPHLQLWSRCPLVLHTAAATVEAREQLRAQGAELLEVAADDEGRVDVLAALEALGKQDIRSLLVEGGGRLLGSFIAGRHWDRLFVFRAPLLLGEGRPAFAGFAPHLVRDAVSVVLESQAPLGPDWLSVWRPRPS